MIHLAALLEEHEPRGVWTPLGWPCSCGHVSEMPPEHHKHVAEVVRQLLVNAWELGWQQGYQSPDLPADPDVPANASFMNPYRIEGVDA